MRKFPPRWRQAFSLVELLAAIAVLSLLVIMVSQMVNSAASLTTDGRKRMDAESQSRLVFDRISADLSKMILRGDIDTLFAKQSGNDKLFFYSEAPAFSAAATNDQSSVALVGYRINAEFQLERLGMLLSWAGTSSGGSPGSVVFLTYAAGSNAPLAGSTLAGAWSATLGTAPQYNGVSDDYHVIGPTIFRFEYVYLLTDGKTSMAPIRNATAQDNLNATAAPSASADSDAGYLVGSRWFDKSQSRPYECLNNSPGAAVWRAIGLKDVSALIVAIGVLDTSSRKIAPADLSMLVSAFPDPADAEIAATPPVLMSEKWNTAMKDPIFAQTAGISKTAAAQVRIYQRTFHLSNH